LRIQVSQGSAAIDLRWTFWSQLPPQYIWEFNSERIIKIGVHLPKLLQK